MRVVVFHAYRKDVLEIHGKLLSQKLYMDHNCQQEVKSSAPRREKRWPQGDYKPFL